MLKSPHSLDPLASWVTCVLLCASCLPHVGLTDHAWRAAFQHVRLMPDTCTQPRLTYPSWKASLPPHGCTDTPVILMYDSWTSHVA
jgi:hypothetical protein